MKRLWTILGVTEVARSFAWYRSLLGLTATQPGLVASASTTMPRLSGQARTRMAG